MTGFTHYSLFQDTATIELFQPLPEGGLPELLADLHRRTGAKPNMCLGIGEGTLHPDGQQMSFGITRQGKEVFGVILFTRDAVADQYNDLAAERNTESAAAARKALAGV